MPAFISGYYWYVYLCGETQLGTSRWNAYTGCEYTLPDLIHHLILPGLILASMQMARIMRYTRFSMLEVLNQDYVLTATAKGMKTQRCHQYPCAYATLLLPVVTIIGLSIPQLIVGAVFLETIYTWPGMGTLYYDAVISRDFPIIMGANLIIAVIVLVANLAN